MHGHEGVCGHVDVSGPGGHWDPGPAFPWPDVISAAKTGGPVFGAAPLPWWSPSRPPILAMGEDEMPPEYVVHDTTKSHSDGENYYACFASGLVRKCLKAERDKWAVPIIDVGLSDPNGERMADYDRALRGQVKERT